MYTPSLPRLVLFVLFVAGGLFCASATPFGPGTNQNNHRSITRARQGVAHYARTLETSSNVHQTRESEIVWSPKVTKPTKGEVVIAGQSFVVAWDTANVPDEKKESEVEILLGYPKDGGEHLDVDRPLGKAPMMAGKAKVVAPANKPTGDKYWVVGDSQNKSPPFTIKNKHRG
ncbi:hypothetical protein ONZ45_g8692 [Pleurotus djamor]|nr:hypothetical protein ONZ45_g8692 [Pleurotus djamor]